MPVDTEDTVASVKAMVQCISNKIHVRMLWQMHLPQMMHISDISVQRYMTIVVTRDSELDSSLRFVSYCFERVLIERDPRIFA